MTVFLDTSYLVALLRRRDAHHLGAIRLRPVFDGPLVTTEFVLLELLDSLAGSTLRPRAISAVHNIRSESRVNVIAASPSLFRDGLDLLEARPDKGWGLTDCTSFVVMQREGLTEALTADRHFEQAGFKALLRSSK